MNRRDYWRKRVLYQRQKENTSNAEYESAMRSRLKDLEKAIEKEAYKYMSLYAKNENISLKQAAEYLKSIDLSRFSMSLAEFEAKAKAGGYQRELNNGYYRLRIARLKALYEQFGKLAMRYAADEENRLGEALATRYSEEYSLANYQKYLATGNLNVNYSHFNEEQIKEIIYQPWQGSNFSKRIWQNYTQKLPELLTDTMLRATLLGYSYQKTTKLLKTRLRSFSDFHLHRLVTTELAHITEQAAEQFYKDSKIKKFQYLAALEARTCDQCAHLDMKVFEVEDAKPGVNYPVMHPFCRCTTIPYEEDLPELTSRWYRDPVTGKSKWVKNQTYAEWAKNNGIKFLTYSQWKKLNGVKRLNLEQFRAAPKPEVKVTNLREFTHAIKDLGIENVKSMNGLDGGTLNAIYKTVASEFASHPELKGMLTTIKGGNRKTKDDVAMVRTKLRRLSGDNPDNARYEFSAELNINKAKVSNIDAVNNLVKRVCSEHVWSYKKDYTGVIRHEMAHAIDNRAVYTLSTGNKDIQILNFKQAKPLHARVNNDSFANDLLLDAFEACHIDPTVRNVKKYISLYAKKSVKEAFAELYSDESNSELSQTFKKLLDKRLKEIYER